MASLDPAKAREFATEAVAKLRHAGYEALWAGVCVRDQLLGCEPKDYDVATSANPDQIRNVFGRRRTLSIGAAFGVITVLGPRVAGQIDVATFRRDAAYSDGRHPDSVSFSNAEEDARRRDFTINGLFYDPLAAQVIDYVGGQADIARELIRAIGDPEERLSEDKLRMLRAIRFATTLGFDIDPETMQAIQRHANELPAVSMERMTAELRRLLQHANRRQGLAWLRQSGLLAQVLPELACDGDAWRQTLAILDAIKSPSFAVVVAALLRALPAQAAGGVTPGDICRRWKLSNEEREGVLLCLQHEATIRQAPATAWPVLQRLLVCPRIDELLSYGEAVAQVVDGTDTAIRACREILARPQSQWNPAPLITGTQLKQLGIPAGRAYGKLLAAVRDAQLNGEISTQDAAVALAAQLWNAEVAE